MNATATGERKQERAARGCWGKRRCRSESPDEDNSNSSGLLHKENNNENI
jgi:hypothetical protein